MPTQTIDCDPELFRFVVRYPEVLVNIWDVMGITKVEIKRTGPFTFTADDSVGTVCTCDLIYGNDQLHIYYGTGAYKGSMTPRQVTGRCVCILHSTSGQKSDGSPIVTGTMDVFLKLDNLGADLLTRTLGPFVGKTADYNFIESAKFISQISEVCENNPEGAQQLISKLQKVNPEVRDEFSRIAAKVGSASWQRIEARELATLGPTRMELPSATVPVAEFQSRSSSTLPADLQEQVQRQNAQLQAGSSRMRAAKLASPADAALQLTLTDSDSDDATEGSVAEPARPLPGPALELAEPAGSAPGRPTVLVPIAPAANGMDRSIAPAKPGVYMRR